MNTKDNENIESLKSAKKNTILYKILSFLSVFNKGDREDTEYYEFTRDVKKSSREYSDITEAINLTKDAALIYEKKNSLLKMQDDLNKRAEDLQNFEKLDDEDVEKLKKIITRLEGINREKQSLRGQITGCDTSVAYLYKYESDIPEVIEEMKAAEERQRLLKQDLSYIEGEKINLEYDREKLVFGVSFIYRFSIVITILFGLLTIFFAVNYIFFERPIYFQAIGLVVFVIILGTVLFIFRRRMNHELIKNEMLSKRAIELLNKKRIHYAHYTNYLNHQYKKYKVKNSHILVDNWLEYGYTKNLKGRHQRILSIAYEAEKELEFFLKKHKLDSSKTTLDRIKRIIDVDNKRMLVRELAVERTRLEDQITILENNHGKIWDRLEELRVADNSEDKKIESIINKHLSEIENHINATRQTHEDKK